MLRRFTREAVEYRERIRGFHSSPNLGYWLNRLLRLCADRLSFCFNQTERAHRPTQALGIIFCIIEIKLPYGQQNGELVTIDDVERGLKCDCICPACYKPLIAKKGERNVHHFAHYKSTDCLGGLETALHILSKDLIAGATHFTTPELYYPNSKHLIFEEQKIPIDSVKLEKKIGDIVIQSGKKFLLIEVVVNNDISWPKLRKIRELDYPVIEIYSKHILRDLYQRQDYFLTENVFTHALIHGTRYKSWIHNPKISRIKSELKQNYAEQKDVKFFKSNELGYYNYVEECPLEKRTWNKGKPYASADHDCRTCNACVGIDYKTIDFKNSEYSTDYPKTVFCLGYMNSEISELIRTVGKVTMPNRR